MDTLLITRKSSPQDISDLIASLREQKGKEKETLALIEKAIIFGHGWVINLFWEEALIYQRLYMSEIVKPQGEQNVLAKKKALAKMEMIIKKSDFYIKKYKLDNWLSRLYRFWGRLYDNRGQFTESSKFYMLAIPLARKDPDWLERKLPRWLELEGFLSYSMIMAGRVKEGLNLAMEVSKKFDGTKEGQALKAKDYTTWTIWKTGITIRTVQAILTKKIKINKELLSEWLTDSEKLLYPSKEIKVWADFKLRRDEVVSTRRQLEKN